MPFGKKKPTPGDRMRYTPHTDAQLARKAELFGEATRVAEQLTVEAGRRGAAWDPSVDLMLAQLNDGMADEEREAAVPTPKIKGTTLKFRCVARAAVTAHLEITKGLYEHAIGWIEVGELVQAQAIGTTMRTGRQRILDAKQWHHNGLSTPGWISITSVNGTALLQREGTQEMPKPAIRTEEARWEGSATRLGVGFEYDPTFLPPPSDVTGSDGLQRRSKQTVAAMSETPPHYAQGGSVLDGEGNAPMPRWKKDRTASAVGAMVRAVFTEGSSVNRDVRAAREADAERQRRHPWPPTEDPPPPLSFGSLPEKQTGYYSELPSGFIDGDYLAFIAKRYPDEKLASNLAAERTAERHGEASGISAKPWRRGKPAAIDLEALDAGRDNRLRPRTSDGTLRLSWAQRCLHHDDAPYRTQMEQYVNTDSLMLRDSAAAPAAGGARPSTADGALEARRDGEPRRFGDAGQMAPPRMYGSDMKRYSAKFAKDMAAKTRRTFRETGKGGVLARQRHSMNKDGVYSRSVEELRATIEQEERDKMAAERQAEIERIAAEKEAARLALIAERERVAAEEKAAAEAAAAAAALKEALESVLEVGGLAKVHEMVADPNAEESVAAAARSLLASLPDNVSLPRY